MSATRTIEWIFRLMGDRDFRAALTCKDQHILHASFVTLLELAKNQIASEGALLPLDIDWRRKYEQLQSDMFCACLETCGAGSHYNDLYARIMELADKNELEGS